MDNFDKEWMLFGPRTGYSVNSEAVEGLYFIYCEEPESIKIGISTSPFTRRSNLGTGSPSELHLIFYSRLFGKSAEKTLHQMLSKHNRTREWFNWNDEVQGFALGIIFAVSGAIQVSWPFSCNCNRSMFIAGVDWAHNFLDPDKNWSLEAMTAIGAESAFELFQSWSDIALSRRRKLIETLPI
ncbi:GIY-YIG nuclease family protein [Pseudomonas sp. BT-42-2]|uniref:GIY-YIG nuclease family protein n=1 Tax=Pseudomonas TaxID=286 RepID=UPI0018AA3F4E|nr:MULTISPECIES: GIY-YIG nuclease family protein [Pseudomonas]MBF8755352.1 GIY-YIG nuclease family protein [Pseudomonas guariconensis]MCV9919596.1 GIY-YIG nuclease family protein [Pseudomonas sp. BT-42-2]